MRIVQSTGPATQVRHLCESGHCRQTPGVRGPILDPRRVKTGRSTRPRASPTIHGDSMTSNRPNRTTPNVRSIIANLGRSIDEARNRRLKPSEPIETAPESVNELRIGATEAPRATSTPDPTPRSNQPLSPPPLRSSAEMFDSTGNRLKARPKRAS